MNTLKLKIFGGERATEAIVYIDGSRIEPKRDQGGNGLYVAQTGSQAHIEIFRAFDTGGVGWFFLQILFFILSVFGLFDTKRRERCYVYEYEADVAVENETTLVLKLGMPKPDGEAFTADKSEGVQVTVNRYYVDKQAKRTRKILLITKIALAAITVLAVALALVLRK